VIRYFTCRHCGGLWRQRPAGIGKPQVAAVEVLIPADPPCPHAWWDESGMPFREIDQAEAKAMMAARGDRP
jgi:hypothetical protein